MNAWLVLIVQDFMSDVSDFGVTDFSLLSVGMVEIKSTHVSVYVTVGEDQLVVHFNKATGNLKKAWMLEKYDGIDFTGLTTEPDLVISYSKIGETPHTILYIAGEKKGQHLELWLSEHSPEKYIVKLPTIAEFR